MKTAVALIVALLLIFSAVRAASLYEQSIAKLLEQRFSSPAIAYLVVDARSETPVASRWENPTVPVPVGSLVKPFIALAYAEGHSFEYPEFVCRGAADGCWLERGHGRVGLSGAIEFSCNAYFRALASRVQEEDVRRVIRRFGIHSAPAGPVPLEWAGLGDGWRIAPEEIARAYCELVAQRDAAGAGEVIAGMALSARAGTGRAVGQAGGRTDALAKTGTAPCLHRRRAPGDGYCIVLYPAESARLALLVQVHGVPGAQAAAVAGEMLRVVVEGR